MSSLSRTWRRSSCSIASSSSDSLAASNLAATSPTSCKLNRSAPSTSSTAAARGVVPADPRGAASEAAREAAAEAARDAAAEAAAVGARGVLAADAAVEAAAAAASRAMKSAVLELVVTQPPPMLSLDAGGSATTSPDSFGLSSKASSPTTHVASASDGAGRAPTSTGSGPMSTDARRSEAAATADSRAARSPSGIESSLRSAVISATANVS
mmetsp:Transcript_7022/g.24377  ORF Transcript_7022/g.24377 Transcript_7022/m.24377 type:complete len:212 (-) Transcript_7022:118-753(-)